MYPLFLLGALGCTADDKWSDSADTGDHVDVLVIGAGPAGVAAALSAVESGAEVRLLERGAAAGDGISYAGRLFVAGSDQQAAAGVTDSPAQAAEEWEAITGVDGGAASVTAFLEGTAPTLRWLEGYGVEVFKVTADQDGGETSRIHEIHGGDARALLVAALGDAVRLETLVDELVVEEGRVVGARWTDLSSGESGSTRAGAVVVATGGFLRDRARVDEWRPDLADRRLLFETNLHADGSGLEFLDALHPGYEAPEEIGLYVHSIQDPDRAEGEALVLGELDEYLIVDEGGARFADEGLARSFDFFGTLPEGEVFAILPDAAAESFSVLRPPYNAADPDVWETWVLPELDTASEDVSVAASASELGALAGFDGEGLQRTLEAVNALVAAGGTDEFGRSFADASAWEDDLLWAVRLTPGLAKGFGGVATELDGHLLDEDGAAIPGIYVVGELAGMIPGGGAGTGFAGSVSACYYGGRVAGAAAAAEALE